MLTFLFWFLMPLAFLVFLFREEIDFKEISKKIFLFFYLFLLVVFFLFLLLLFFFGYTIDLLKEKFLKKGV